MCHPQHLLAVCRGVLVLPLLWLRARGVCFRFDSSPLSTMTMVALPWYPGYRITNLVCHTRWLEWLEWLPIAADHITADRCRPPGPKTVVDMCRIAVVVALIARAQATQTFNNGVSVTGAWPVPPEYQGRRKRSLGR